MIPRQELLDSVALVLDDASREISTRLLGMEAAPIPAGRPSGTEYPDRAAYVAILGKDLALQIGILASPDLCVALTQRLLGLSAADPVPAPKLVQDAMGEIANMLAGQVKQALQARFPGLQMGLPYHVTQIVAAPIFRGYPHLSVRYLTLGDMVARGIARCRASETSNRAALSP